MESCEEICNGITSLTKIDEIGIITIKNGKENKIYKPDFLDIKVLDDWISSNSIKGIIITGDGRNFSTGADVDNIKANKNNTKEFEEKMKKGKEILNYIEELPIITVAAVSGACFGAGFEIALSCQFRICTTNSIFAFPESTIGIMPGFAGTIRLPKKVGKEKAIEIIMTGKIIDSEEAYNLGLVNKIVDKKTHISEAINFIEEITKNRSRKQINYIITSINNSDKENKNVAMIKEGQMFADLVKEIGDD